MNPIRSPRAVVIGTGRCGTGHTAALLKANGINAGHEEWFGPRQDDGYRTPGLDVDVSWLALPDLEAGRWRGPMVHIVRNPVDVVRSLVGIDFFTPKMAKRNPYAMFARHYCPTIQNLDPVTAAVEWWVEWNTRCAEVTEIAPIRIEDMGLVPTIKGFGATLGLSLEPKPVATNTNTRKRAEVQEDTIWPLLKDRAAQFGYVPEEPS